MIITPEGIKFFTEYSDVPEELVIAASRSKATAINYGCSTDASDCSSDGACTSDHGCSVDSSDCSTDGACTSDGICSKDSPCSDCSDCSDTPKVPLPAGNITSTSSTDSTITIRFAKISGAVGYQVAIRMESVSGSAITYNIGNNTSYTFTGLAPDTAYVVNYRGIDSDGDYGSYITPSGPTVRTKKAFTKFNWTYAGKTVNGVLVNGSTKTAGLVVYVTADEWNELAELVRDVTGSTVSRVTSGTTITASIVNTAARALGVSTVTKNVTEISASFFNRLRNAYNNLAPT